MSSVLGVFDDIPRCLLSSNAELKRRAQALLENELNRRGVVRRPWGSIEPFIVALYHVVFNDKDVKIGELLLKYLDSILSNAKNVLPTEVREAADIVLRATRAEIGEIDKSSALNYIQNYKATLVVPELVKRVALIELGGEYDEQLDKLLMEVSGRTEQIPLDLLEKPDSRDLIEHFFLDLDAVRPIEESRSMYTILGYFVQRARELQKRYEERRKIIDPIKNDYEKSKQEYDKFIKDLTSKIERRLSIIISAVAGAITGFLGFMLSKSLLISGTGGTVTFFLLLFLTNLLKQPDVISSHISKIASKIARWVAPYTRKGRNMIEDIKCKEGMLKYLESELRKLR